MGSPVIIKKVTNDCILILQYITVSTLSQQWQGVKTGAPRLANLWPQYIPFLVILCCDISKWGMTFGENVWCAWADESSWVHKLCSKASLARGVLHTTAIISRTADSTQRKGNQIAIVCWCNVERTSLIPLFVCWQLSHSEPGILQNNMLHLPSETLLEISSLYTAGQT